jgi:hypothetical protein
MSETSADLQPLDPGTSEEATSTPEKTTGTPKNRLLLPLIAVAVVAALAIGGGIAALVTGATDAAALNEQLAAQTDRADHLSSQLASYKERETELLEREGAVDTRSAELDRREETVSATEEHIEATTLRDGFAYSVGTTMQAGTYQATATSGTCYWEITVSGTNYDDIVQNDLGTNGTLSVTVGAGQDFQSQRCGPWTKIG